uniref:BTB domain-containing protein n=1 Tax=Lepeophtheirus salmonis TaxID=72036 RepID=A0A0K2V5A2_LEPSM
MSNPGRSSTKYRSINFSGHHAHIIEIARSCRNEEKFTDVIFQCSNGKVFAHRLVLASCSSFMSQLFLSLPQGLSEYMIIIPNIRKEIVEILLNFIYTGEMMLSKSNTWDLQQLVHILHIDPENVKIYLNEDALQKPQNPLGPSKKEAIIHAIRGKKRFTGQLYLWER